MNRSYVVPISEDVRQRFHADLLLLKDEITEKLTKFGVKVLTSKVTREPSPVDLGTITFTMQPSLSTNPMPDAMNVLTATARNFLSDHDWPAWTEVISRYEPEWMQYRCWLRCHPHGLRGVPFVFPDDLSEEQIAVKLERLAHQTFDLASSRSPWPDGELTAMVMRLTEAPTEPA